MKPHKGGTATFEVFDGGSPRHLNSCRGTVQLTPFASAGRGAVDRPTTQQSAMGLALLGGMNGMPLVS